jgi:hypothetical protein
MKMNEQRNVLAALTSGKTARYCLTIKRLVGFHGRSGHKDEESNVCRLRKFTNKLQCPDVAVRKRLPPYSHLSVCEANVDIPP